MPERKNEFGDTLRYKSGSRSKARFVGTRVNQGKRETRTFTGDLHDVLERWGEWTHACDREPPAEPTPMVPRAYRVREEDLSTRKLTDEQRAEIIELIEAGGMLQTDIAEAYGVSPATISDIKRAHAEREARRAERERVKEEESRLRREEAERREEEVNATRLEAVPENFLPRRTEKPEQRCGAAWFVIAPEGANLTLFPDADTAERVAEMLRMYDPTLRVIECRVWGE